MWKGVPDAPKTLGENLHRKRVVLGLKDVEIAQLLGVAETTVTSWEHNRKPISNRGRAKIVAFLGYDPDDEQSPSS